MSAAAAQELCSEASAARRNEQGTDLLRELRAAIPASCRELSARTAWLELARAYGQTLAGVGLLALQDWSCSRALLWRVPLTLGLWGLTGLGMVSLFVIGHDCGHYAFSKHRAINVVVGYVCLSPILTGYDSWQLAHDQHHAHCQRRGLDPDWPELMMTREEWQTAPVVARLFQRLVFASWWGIAFGFLASTLRRAAPQTLYGALTFSRKARRRALASSWFAIGIFTCLSLALLSARGVTAMLVAYWVPFLIAAGLGGFITRLHHTHPDALVFDEASWTPLRGQTSSTFDVRLPAVLERSLLHINRHLVHHLAPKIPWYRLPSASEALQHRHPFALKERKFSLTELGESFRCHLLERQPDGTFAMRPEVSRTTNPDAPSEANAVPSCATNNLGHGTRLEDEPALE